MRGNTGVFIYWGARGKESTANNNPQFLIISFVFGISNNLANNLLRTHYTIKTTNFAKIFT